MQYGSRSLLRRKVGQAILHAALLMAVLAGTPAAATGFETAFDPGTERMPVGDGVFEVVDVPRGPVSIYSYRPAAATNNSPIWIVMPGARRYAHRTLAFDYYDTWRPLADQLRRHSSRA